MPGGGTQTTTQTQSVPPELMARYTENYDYAKGLAAQPFQPYTTPRVAPASNQEQHGRMMMEQAALGGLGQRPLNQAIDTATRASTATAPMVQAQGGFAQTAGPIERVNAPTIRDAALTPWRQTNDAAHIGWDRIDSPTMIDAKIADNFHGAGTAAIDRRNIGDVRAGAITDPGRMAAYRNIYDDQAINLGLGDIERSRQLARTGDKAAATQARAFGGGRHGVVEAETNRAYDENAARFIGQQRQAGFDRSASLLTSDLDRAMQAGAQNQDADLTVAGQNAGFTQQTGLTNAAAANAREQFNAQQRHAKNVVNQAASNEAQRLNQATALAARRANQDATNRAGEVNLSAAQAHDQYNADAINGLNRGNQAVTMQALTGNAGAYNDLQRFNAGHHQQMELFNAGQRQAAGFQNQDAVMRALGINMQGAGMLGGFADQQRNFGFGDAHAMSSAGLMDRDLHQRGLDAMYEEEMRRQGYPMQQMNLRNSALGLMPTPMNNTTRAPGPDRFGQILGAGATLGSAFLMSDERVKRNIRTVGYDKRGHRWADFEYIFQPGVIYRGVIAQEAQRIDPHAVREIGGVLHVDYAQLGV